MKKEQEIKITRAGYLYIDGVKISKKTLTPLSVVEITAGLTDEAHKKCADWVSKNWRMV